MAFQGLVAKSQSEFQHRKDQLVSPIAEKMRQIIAEVAHEKGFSAVQNVDAGVLFVAAEDDLTDLAVSRFESSPLEQQTDSIRHSNNDLRRRSC